MSAWLEVLDLHSGKYCPKGTEVKVLTKVQFWELDFTEIKQGLHGYNKYFLVFINTVLHWVRGLSNLSGNSPDSS